MRARWSRDFTAATVRSRIGATSALAVLHETGVGGDPVEPGRERRFDLEALDPPVSGEEGVLERLGGVLLMPEDLERQPIHLVPVAAHELVEGPRVAALRAPHQVFIVLDAIVDAHREPRPETNAAAARPWSAPALRSADPARSALRSRAPRS